VASQIGRSGCARPRRHGYWPACRPRSLSARPGAPAAGSPFRCWGCWTAPGSPNACGDDTRLLRWADHQRAVAPAVGGGGM